MPEIQFGTHSVRDHGAKVVKIHIHDWAILLLLFATVYGLNQLEPFRRFIGEDMMSNIKYPMKKNTIPMWAVPVYAELFPMLIFLIYYIVRKDVYDLHHATLGILYSGGLTGVITDAIKIAVGRPRPNFFYRCFPDGIATFNNVTHDVLCHGDIHEIREGYKSFPSGHTSWSFAGFVFLSWYISGKIRAFNQGGHVAKLCIVFLPILFAALVGVSRVDDYWHHWQDVFAGAIIGTVISTFCYLQFFPYPNDKKGWAPHAYFQVLEERSRSTRFYSNVQHDIDIGSPCAGSDHVLIEISGGGSTPTDTVPVPSDVEARRSSQH